MRACARDDKVEKNEKGNKMEKTLKTIDGHCMFSTVAQTVGEHGEVVVELNAAKYLVKPVLEPGLALDVATHDEATEVAEKIIKDYAVTFKELAK